MVNYLYTGIIERPKDYELFDQLLAYYDLEPNYTLDRQDLKIIRKANVVPEPEKIHSNPDGLKREIKQEKEDKSMCEIHDAANNVPSQIDDVNEGIGYDTRIKQELGDEEYFTMNNDGVGNDVVKDAYIKKGKSNKKEQRVINILPKIPDQMEMEIQGEKDLNLDKNIEIQEDTDTIATKHDYSENDLYASSDDEDFISDYKISEEIKRKEVENAITNMDTTKSILEGQERIRGMEKEFIKWRRNHSCHDCKDGFSDFKNLIDHFYKTKGYKEYKEDNEHEETIVESDYHDYRYYGSKKKKKKYLKLIYTCDVCGKVCKYKSEFNTHMRTHTGEMVGSCRICRKSFNTYCYLRAHIAQHTMGTCYFIIQETSNALVIKKKTFWFWGQKKNPDKRMIDKWEKKKCDQNCNFENGKF